MVPLDQPIASSLSVRGRKCVHLRPAAQCAEYLLALSLGRYLEGGLSFCDAEEQALEEGVDQGIGVQSQEDDRAERRTLLDEGRHLELELQDLIAERRHQDALANRDLDSPPRACLKDCDTEAGSQIEAIYRAPDQPRELCARAVVECGGVVAGPALR